jgi:hypothetical protein
MGHRVELGCGGEGDPDIEELLRHRGGSAVGSSKDGDLGLDEKSRHQLCTGTDP